MSYGLLRSLSVTDSFGKENKPITDHWAIRLNTICSDLKTTKISQTQRQEEVETLLSWVPLKDLLKFIDFQKLTQNFSYPELGVNTKRVKFPKLDGLPSNTAFYKKIFGMQKGNATIPHGHSNMSSSYMVLKGRFDLKHYDKV